MHELAESRVGTTFEAFLGAVPAASLVEIMERTSYLYLYGERNIAPKTAFYKRLIAAGDLEDFLVVVPQPATEPTMIDGVGPRSVVSRDRREGRGNKFGEITEPKHRSVVEKFVSNSPHQSVADFFRPTRGAMLLYVVRERKPDYDPSELVAVASDHEESGLIAAFSAYLPNGALASNPRSEVPRSRSVQEGRTHYRCELCVADRGPERRAERSGSFSALTLTC